MLTILDVLRNARHNLDSQLKQSPHPLPFLDLGMNQLSNALTLIDRGKELFDEFKEEDLK